MVYWGGYLEAKIDQQTMGRPDESALAPRRRWPYAALAYVCTALALAGVALPGLPTTPFLLVAAWAARHGSPRLDRWLRAHRHLGPLLYHWETERAVPRRAKWLAVIVLSSSWVLLALLAEDALVPIIAAFPMGCVAVFVLTRPTPAAITVKKD